MLYGIFKLESLEKWLRRVSKIFFADLPGFSDSDQYQENIASAGMGEKYLIHRLRTIFQLLGEVLYGVLFCGLKIR
jgi:hypothetical protein